MPLRKADAWALERELARVVGDPERRYRAAMIRHHRLIDAAPQPGDAEIWRDLFPQGYAAYVDPAARALGVDPALIYAFIRKESAFDRDAVSPAHAVGLMQLLPRTARGIQSLRNDASAPTPDLFDPGTNVELGSWYVHALQTRFGGQLPLVAAAYNAGPTSLLGWFRGRKSAEVDVFVETIPFKETREYVKRMVEARVAYAMVWEALDVDRAAAVLPLSLDLTVRPGVDF
ncbi:MAG: lytic transglycosylase domain-containing protein [Myxococcales bacterium]|nr:lytic transglycosylase domain-containing protein [Myxococcales bacterium]